MGPGCEQVARPVGEEGTGAHVTQEVLLVLLDVCECAGGEGFKCRGSIASVVGGQGAFEACAHMLRYGSEVAHTGVSASGTVAREKAVGLAVVWELGTPEG